MKITALGVNGPYPAAGGACSGYLYESDDGTRIVIDLGAGTLARLLTIVPIDAVDALVLSHLHFDHMSDVLPLRYALDFSGRQNLLVIAPSAPKAVRTLIEGGRMDVIEPRDMKVKDISLSFIPAVHPVPGVSIALEADGVRVVHTGDTNRNDALELFSDGADALIADAGLLTEDYTPRAAHMSARLCGELALRASVKQLFLSHLSPRYAPEAVLSEAREVYPRAELLKPLETIRL